MANMQPNVNLKREDVVPIIKKFNETLTDTLVNQKSLNEEIKNTYEFHFKLLNAKIDDRIQLLKTEIDVVYKKQLEKLKKLEKNALMSHRENLGKLFKRTSSIRVSEKFLRRYKSIKAICGFKTKIYFSETLRLIKYFVGRIKLNEIISALPEAFTKGEIEYLKKCKLYYKITGKPLISISQDFEDKQLNYVYSKKPEYGFDNLITIVIKIAIDTNYNTFKFDAFLMTFCNKFSKSKYDINFARTQNGSVLLELRISGQNIQIELIAQTFRNLNFEEELVKMKVFFLFMGTTFDMKCKAEELRNKIILHPRFNKLYGMGHIYWSGALRDGRDRGRHEYYCPVGWKRISLFVCDDFDTRFNGYSICYHGTKFQFGLSILLSGLMPAQRIALGPGIYASQSIIYAAHPRYSEVKEITTNEGREYFKNGNYIQFVLECRVKNTNIQRIDRETLRIGDDLQIDPNIPNNSIEWVINHNNQNIVLFNDTNATIVCTGIMIRVTDNHPGLLADSSWWLQGYNLPGIKSVIESKRNNRETCAIINF